MAGKKRIIIGLTGSFGSGKSTVARIFARHGAAVVDADRLAHRLIAPGTDIYRKVVKAFGAGILDRKGKIAREKLGRLVFRDKGKLELLNRMIHPEVKRIIRERIRAAQNVVVLDVPLLFEAGMDRLCNKTIVVFCDRTVQLRRLSLKRGLTTPEALLRLNSQMPLEKKVRLADFVIDNSGSIKKTKKQVSELRRKLWKS